MSDTFFKHKLACAIITSARVKYLAKRNCEERHLARRSYSGSVGGHLCGECMKSKELNVGQKLLSMWWLIEQVCSLTKECQVYQFVPNTSIFRDTLRTCSGQFSNRFQLLLLKVVSIQARLKLCTIALSFYLPVHNISRPTFEHVLPCRKTMREIQLLPQVLEDFFSRYRWSEICSLRNSYLVPSMWMSSPRSSFLLLADLADSPLLPGGRR